MIQEYSLFPSILQNIKVEIEKDLKELVSEEIRYRITLSLYPLRMMETRIGVQVWDITGWQGNSFRRTF